VRTCARVTFCSTRLNAKLVWKQPFLVDFGCACLCAIPCGPCATIILLQVVLRWHRAVVCGGLGTTAGSEAAARVVVTNRCKRGYARLQATRLACGHDHRQPAIVV